MSKMCDEWCSHCESDVEIPADRISNCPVCNEEIVPCSACVSSDGNDNKCNWTDAKGCYMHKKSKKPDRFVTISIVEGQENLRKDTFTLDRPIELADIYEKCNCDIIDMPMRVIDGKRYCFVVDDCGRMRDNARCTMYFSETGEDFVGNVLICNIDREGETIPLTDEEIQHLNRHMMYYPRYGMYVVV